MRAVNVSTPKPGGLFALLRADCARALTSWPFYTAILGVACLNLLNVWDELQYMLFTIHAKPTVAYMYNIRNAMGPYIVVFLCALPFASSFCADWNSRYTRYNIIRASTRSYGWSKVIVTAFTGSLAIFIGTGLFLGVLAIFLPVYDPGSHMTNEVFQKLLPTSGPLAYFTASILFDAMGYGFLAVFALWISTKITNVFVVMSSPIIFYYGWQYLCGAAGLPEIVVFQHVMNINFLQNRIQDAGLCILYAAGYFLILILMFGALFSAGVKRRLRNG